MHGNEKRGSVFLHLSGEVLTGWKEKGSKTVSRAREAKPGVKVWMVISSSQLCLVDADTTPLSHVGKLHQFQNNQSHGIYGSADRLKKVFPKAASNSHIFKAEETSQTTAIEINGTLMDSFYQLY